MKSLVKKILLSIVALATLTLITGIIYLEVKYEGIGLPWTTKIDLPEFPQQPEPTTELSIDDSGMLYFHTKSPYDFSVLLNDYDNAKPTIGRGELFLPDNASIDKPVAALIILHGSGGIVKGREKEYAKLFAKQGIASLILDYYQPRGVTEKTPYLKKMLSSTEVDIIVDAYSALKLLATHPLIDARRIGVTGYSYGGMATRYTLDPRLRQIIAPDVPPFALHMDIYGPCHQTLGESRTTGGDYLAIFGDQDNSVDPQACERVQAMLRQAGTDVERYIIKGAGHAWENTKPRKEYGNPYIKDCTFSFHPQTGHLLVNNKPAKSAGQNATRGERALIRTRIQIEAPECIKQGYIVGKDEASDRQAKSIMIDYLKRKGFITDS